MNEPRAATLYSYHSDQNLTLQEAITSCQEVLVSAIALLYSPQSCQIAKLTNNQLQNSCNKAINNWQDIFEARIFNYNCELRWLNRNNEKGEVVLLSEEKFEYLAHFDQSDSTNCEQIEQQYLLWGEKAKNSPQNEGWQRLAEARIGKLDIAFKKNLEENQRVCLKTWEYIGQIDSYGNFGVIEERLVGLETLEKKK